MKKQSKVSVSAIIASLALAGIVRAENNSIEVKDSGNDTRTIIEQLVNEGYLIPMNEENWYQINQEKLDLLEHNNDRDRVAQIVDMLQSLVGPDVDIRTVDAFEAGLSSQDYPGKGQ